MHLIAVQLQNKKLTSKLQTAYWDMNMLDKESESPMDPSALLVRLLYINIIVVN